MASSPPPDVWPAAPVNPLFNQSLDKGLAVLRAFDAAHRTLTLAELATLTGVTRGSAQRTVHTLQQLGPGLAQQADRRPRAHHAGAVHPRRPHARHPDRRGRDF